MGDEYIETEGYTALAILIILLSLVIIAFILTWIGSKIFFLLT